MSYYRIIFIHTSISLLKKTLPSDQQHHISSIASAASHQQHHSSITSAASHQQHHLNSDHFHHKPNVLIFFPYCSNEWNNLKGDMRNAKSLNIFKKLIFSKK